MYALIDVLLVEVEALSPGVSHLVHGLPPREPVHQIVFSLEVCGWHIDAVTER